jgi:hypothetical protein
MLFDDPLAMDDILNFTSSLFITLTAHLPSLPPLLTINTPFQI